MIHWVVVPKVHKVAPTVERCGRVIGVFHDDEEWIAGIVDVEPIGTMGEERPVEGEDEAVRTVGVAPVVLCYPVGRKSLDDARGDAHRERRSNSVETARPGDAGAITPPHAPPTTCARLTDKAGFLGRGAQSDRPAEAHNLGDHAVVEGLMARIQVAQTKTAAVDPRPEPWHRDVVGARTEFRAKQRFPQDAEASRTHRSAQPSCRRVALKRALIRPQL